MSVISSHRDGGASSHHLGFTLHSEVAGGEFGNSSIASSNEEISVAEELHDVDSLLEESFGWANSFEETLVKANFNDVSGKSSKIGNTVIWGDHNALVNSLNLSHGEILIEDFLLDEITVPDADTIVVDRDKVVVGVVEESNFVCDVHANSMSTDGFSCLSLNLKEKGRIRERLMI